MPEIIQGFPFEFYGEVYVAYLASDRQFYISLNDICRGLGVDARSQRRRIQDDEAIADKLVNLALETPYQEGTRTQEVACLSLRALPYWLGTIDARRVKDEIRPRVILFKRDFAETAWFVYRGEILPPEIIAEVDSYATPYERELAEMMADFRSLKNKLDTLTGRVDEELARVGLSETEARRQGIPFEVTRYDLEDLDRAIADGDNTGFIKVLTLPGRGRILGAAIVGSHAGEMIGEFVTAMGRGRGLGGILGTIHPYPTWGEANRHLAGAWRRAHAPAALLPWLERYFRWMR